MRPSSAWPAAANEARAPIGQPPSDDLDAAMPAPQLRWRDPVLLERTDADDLDVLLLHEGRLVAADERRAKCLASLRSLLRGQKYNRDRVRAHGGEGRDALRDTLVHGVRHTDAG